MPAARDATLRRGVRCALVPHGSNQRSKDTFFPCQSFDRTRLPQMEEQAARHAHSKPLSSAGRGGGQTQRVVRPTLMRRSICPPRPSFAPQDHLLECYKRLPAGDTGDRLLSVHQLPTRARGCAAPSCVHGVQAALDLLLSVGRQVPKPADGTEMLLPCVRRSYVDFSSDMREPGRVNKNPVLSRGGAPL